MLAAAAKAGCQKVVDWLVLHDVDVTRLWDGGNALAASGDDHSVRLWTNTAPGPQQEIDRICRTARDLTTTVRQTYLPGPPRQSARPDHRPRACPPNADCTTTGGTTAINTYDTADRRLHLRRAL
ncbi:hypothetical protein [Streptomyces sp. NBC_01198]|uniref:hypothetical protein n=1 Tax=Streptomyces sp. NBC_01198 TaxID=2903769 RepID=UPI002E13B99C|nr:hypothetical protein OG702_06115 [Streptomyces sp. NBC_01198]